MKFRVPESPKTDKDENELTISRGRALARILLFAASLIGGAEATVYYYHTLQIWESYLLTPLVPILITISLFIDYEVQWLEEPWIRRKIQDEFRKSSMLLSGGVMTAIGLAVFMSSISTELPRVTVDVATGSTLICAGLYVVKRFSW
jgi:hypothetical protein